jgi:hypothetical protein
MIQMIINVIRLPVLALVFYPIIAYQSAYEIDVTTIPDYMVTSDIFCLYPLVLLVMNMCEIFTSGH